MAVPRTGDAASGPRKLRVLALHGGASNSKIMRFQCGQFRKQLGKDAEWLYLDGPSPWWPGMVSNVAGTPLEDYNAPRSELEHRLAGVEPFVSWIVPEYSASKGMIVDNRESVHRCAKYVIDYITKEAPIDVIVAYTQGAVALNAAAERYRLAGTAVPWRLQILFCGTPVLADFVGPHVCPTACVTSPLDPQELSAMPLFRNFYSRLIGVYEHDEGLSFPSKPPRSTEIYEQLEALVREHCGDLLPGAGTSSPLEALPPRRHAAPPPAPHRVTATSKAAEAAHDPEEVLRWKESLMLASPRQIQPEELAGLLRMQSCVVIDTRPQFASRARPFPSARQDLSYSDLVSMQPTRVHQLLAQLRKEARQLVLVSLSGDGCEEFGAALVSKFRFPADRVAWLAGGLRAWELWELEHCGPANEIRRSCNLPLLLETSFPALDAQELASLLTTGACLVVDARERSEIRGNAFPGALQDVGLQTLQRRPREAERALREVREDGRRVVAVSVTGLRCGHYCAKLSQHFGLQAERLCWLRGGIAAWDTWAAEHAEEEEEIRSRAGLPRVASRAGRGRRALDAGGGDACASAREHSLSLLRA